MEKLKVQMLGGFSLAYDGAPITLERNSSTKVTQLLEYLIYYRGVKVPRDVLISVLYGDDDVLNPQNNLKVSVFRLRKLLKNSPLPEGDYIVQESGMYFWHGEIETEVDAEQFEKLAQSGADFRIEEAERLKYLRAAISMYRGDFLPMISSEEWVSIEAVKYRSMYMTCVRAAYELLQSRDDYASALEIASAAVKIYPYEEQLHLMRISALVALRQYQEALSAYDEAARLFMNELGITPSEQMTELYRQITGDTLSSTALITEVKAGIRETGTVAGAYYCNYPGFIDSYRFLCRLVRRSGQSMFLMLCTITDTQGIPLELGDRLTESADVLKSSIYKSLRNSDLYTRYSPCQYLVLLTGINKENCKIVSERITALFREQCDVRGVRLHHSVTSGIDVDIPDKPVKFSSNPWSE